MSTLEKKSPPIGSDGKPMTVWQIWLRRLCWVVLGWSLILLGAVTVLFVLGFSSLIDWLEDVALFDHVDTQVFTTFFGISAFAGTILDVVVAILGIRGANNPSKIALFFWIVLVDAVLTTWALASNLSLGVVDPMGLLSGVLMITLAICAWQVRKQTGYFDNHPA